MYVKPVTTVQDSGVDRIFEDKGSKVSVQETKKDEVKKNEHKKVIKENESKEPEKKVNLEERSKLEREKLDKAMEQLRNSLPNAEARYDIHEETNRIMIKLVDKDTNEVIREIPDEKILDIIAKCQQVSGVLVDHSV